MRAQTTQFFQSKLVVPLEIGSDLAEYSIQSVPMLLGALETRKLRSFYVSDADTKEAVEQITKLQKELLMGAKRDLIIEIRGIRGRTGETLADVDPDVVPVGLYSGIQLNDIVEKMGTELGVQIDTELLAVNDKLQLLVEAAQTPEDQTAILEILGNILLALA